MTSNNQNILLVTGRLAENSLRRAAESIQHNFPVSLEIQVLPISVAALMTPRWVAKHISIDPHIDRVILPGFCDGDLSALENTSQAYIEIGPKDLRYLPEYFGQPETEIDLSKYDIEIIAEINHAPRYSRQEIISIAKRYADAGADLIDIGCEVDQTWNEIGDYIQAIRDLGLRVSVDSLNPVEIKHATKAGAELVLSVNSSNIEYAAEFDAEVVLIPDDPNRWQEVEVNIERLEADSVKFRVDPIIEPIGFGFAASLQRYMLVRERWPQLPMMMGIGNLSEMTEVDSAGINMLLLAICQELEIHSVLTTEVINWAKSSVKECDFARRLVRESIDEQVPPKHIDSSLVCLRDARVSDLGVEAIAELAGQIRDFNYRIFADSGELHVLGGGHHLRGTDPFELFDQLTNLNPKNLTPSHAFYLGYELQKAATALQLGKQYSQDEALNWGHLTVDEKNRHRLAREKYNR